MKNTWVIVANQAEAQIYTSRRVPWEIKLLRTLKHEEGAAHARDLLADAPGRSHDRMGPARHMMEPSTGVKQESLRRFVKEMTDVLAAAYLKNRFEQLVIMAAPAVLGVIRKNLGNGLSRSVVKEISKDVIGQGMDDLESQLKRAFELK
jgi:protein required for attachment to host cells